MAQFGAWQELGEGASWQGVGRTEGSPREIRLLSEPAVSDPAPPARKKKVKKLRLGKRERKEAKRTPPPASPGSSAATVRSECEPVMRARFARWEAVLVLVVLLLQLAQLSWRSLPGSAGTSPEAKMIEHSNYTLASTRSLALPDKFALQKSTTKVDTFVITDNRENATRLFKQNCALPTSICSAMAQAIWSQRSEFHKKDAVPFDGFEGAYCLASIWVEEVGDNKVMVAWKAAAIGYKLRDVVEYVEKVEVEPVIACEDQTWAGWMTTVTTQHCRKVSETRTVSHLPVFRPAVLTPAELELVTAWMDRTLAIEVLRNAKLLEPIDQDTVHHAHPALPAVA